MQMVHNAESPDVTTSRVQSIRHRARERVRAELGELCCWVETDSVALPLHRVSEELFVRLMEVALLLLSWWSSLLLDEEEPATCRVYGAASYTLSGWRRELNRTRFGVFFSWEPVYVRHQGKGPLRLHPHARRMGLAAGRMSLDVHLMVVDLATRMPFGSVSKVAAVVGMWTPGPRAMLGIVDKLGPKAIDVMLDPATPEECDEGTHVVLERDDGGIPHVKPEELATRRRPNRRKTRTGGPETRLEKRRRRRGHRVARDRRQTGDKSKNCRMATVYVLYTLRVHEDGTVEGPLNRQVFAATGDKTRLRKTVLRAAKARGWGKKPSFYLADGASSNWTAWKASFNTGPKVTACLDWFHAAEYLWQAADAVFRVVGVAPKGKQARRRYKKKKQTMQDAKSAWVRARQDELLAGRIDDALQELHALGAQIGSSGPGTRCRREKVSGAWRYLNNLRGYLTYSKMGSVVMGTGVVEGTIKQLGARLKGPGMRWSVERAERLLALRCLQLSDDAAWERFEKRVEEDHEAVTSLIVPAISPTTPLTGHSARKKAA